MQFPFLTLGVPNYITYGMVGAVIGHEVSHAFDDQGETAHSTESGPRSRALIDGCRRSLRRARQSARLVGHGDGAALCDEDAVRATVSKFSWRDPIIQMLRRSVRSCARRRGGHSSERPALAGREHCRQRRSEDGVQCGRIFRVRA